MTTYILIAFMRLPLSKRDSNINVFSASEPRSPHTFWHPSRDPPIRDLTNCMCEKKNQN